MPSINSRAKGARGELAFAKMLSDVTGEPHRRGQQYSGIEGKDILPVDPDCQMSNLHWEVKNVERLNVHKAMEQSLRDADKGQIACVAHTRNGQPWLVTVRLIDLMDAVEFLNGCPNGVNS